MTSVEIWICVVVAHGVREGIFISFHRQASQSLLSFVDFPELRWILPPFVETASGNPLLRQTPLYQQMGK